MKTLVDVTISRTMDMIIDVEMIRKLRIKRMNALRLGRGKQLG